MQNYRYLRQKIPTLLLYSSLSFLATPNLVQAQPDFDKISIGTIPVGDGIYMLTGEGGNIGVSAGEDGVFLIDDQFAPLSTKIQTAISNISSEPIRFLINTHYHFDHTGGNENLGKIGVVIVAHDNVRQQMTVDHVYDVLGMTIPASPTSALPIITFNDTVTFHLNGETIHAFHVASAHTDGDSVIHFQEANVIHTGDVYFNGVYPFIDIDNGGSIEGIIAAVDRIIALCDDETKIIPGHGSLSNLKELLAYKQMLITVKERTETAIKKGISLEDFIASKPMADYDDTWGKGFLTPAQFLTIVHHDLAHNSEHN